MQDRAFSPESAEEVIELLDIVEPSADMSGSDAAENIADDIAADDALDLTDVILADAECDGGAQMASDEPPLEESSEQDSSEMLDSAPEAEQGVLGEASEESEACREEVVPASLPVPGSSVPDISADVEACLSLAAEVDERVRQLEERHNAELDGLRERLEASEKRCAELTAEVDSIQQHLAQSSSAFLEDASVRMTLDEMVSRMIELRMPAVLPAEMQEETEEELGQVEQVSDDSFSLVEDAEANVPASDMADLPAEPAEDVDADAERAEEECASRQVIIETIEELAQHVSALEERVADWELRCEQEAALAAARVIREEIAALKAGAARLGR